jgi:hypothetical protein
MHATAQSLHGMVPPPVRHSRCGACPRPPACHVAAAALPMAVPLSQQEVAQLVCDLGMESKQEVALEKVALLRSLQDGGSLAAIATAGAVPLVVQLLGPGSSTDVKEMAAYALMFLNQSDAIAAIIAAGAIPPLVQLLRSDSPADACVKEAAAAALFDLIGKRAETATTIAAAVAIPALIQLLKPDCSVSAHMSAIGTLFSLAQHAELLVAIAAAGAVP